MPRTNQTSGQPHCRYHPQPEHEKRRKRGRHIDPSGYDAGKKINGKKRHILVDTLGLPLHAIVHPPGIQDRGGGMLVLSTLFGMYPFLQKLFADGGYQRPVFQKALAKALPPLEIEIVKRPDHAKASRFSHSLGSRTHLRLAQPMPATGQGLRKPHPQCLWHSCVSPRSASCSENFVINNQLSGPTLRLLHLLTEIRRVHMAHRGRHGTPEIHAALRAGR